MIELLTAYPQNTTMVIVWLCICIGCLVLEGATTEIVSIYFSFGALVSMICAIFGLAFWPQIWVYLIIVALTLFTTRPIFIKYLKSNEIKTNVDAIVGKRFKLLKAITETEVGSVTIADVEWRAVSTDNSSIDANSSIEVLSIEGSKLIVKKID